jgi:hypothetical protein
MGLNLTTKSKNPVIRGMMKGASYAMAPIKYTGEATGAVGGAIKDALQTGKINLTTASHNPQVAKFFGDVHKALQPIKSVGETVGEVGGNLGVGDAMRSLGEGLGMKEPSEEEGGGPGKGFGQMNRFSPETVAALHWLLQQGQQNSDFGPIEERARNQFYSQTVPSLASRFTSMGGLGRSSGFQDAIGRAGSDLESQIAALRSQYGLQQFGLGIQPQYENYYMMGQPSIMQSALSSLLPLAGKAAIGGMIGGPAGAGIAALGGLPSAKP